MAWSSEYSKDLRSRRSPNPVLSPMRLPRRLPPLVVEGRKPYTSAPRAPPPTPVPEPWSNYHTSCSYDRQPRQKQSQRRLQNTKETSKSTKEAAADHASAEGPASTPEVSHQPDTGDDGPSNQGTRRKLLKPFAPPRQVQISTREMMQSGTSDAGQINQGNQGTQGTRRMYPKVVSAPRKIYISEISDTGDAGLSNQGTRRLMPRPFAAPRLISTTEMPDTGDDGPSNQGTRRKLLKPFAPPRQVQISTTEMMQSGTSDAGQINQGNQGTQGRRRMYPKVVSAPRKIYISEITPRLTKVNIELIKSTVTSMLPGVTIQMYLISPSDDVFFIKPVGKVYTSAGHSRFVRSLFAAGETCFMTESDLPCMPDPPKRIFKNFSKKQFVAYVPVALHMERYLLEIWSSKEYVEDDKQLLCAIARLVSITLQYHRLYHTLLQESQMSAFLLEVAQAVFEEMVSLDLLIKKILEVAQRLVNADRASLFLVDYRNLELVSTVFDLRYEPKNDSDFSKKEIRMPIDKGIAGHVAMSGETMNIPDAYSDQRFNKTVDEATGYRTVSILCMPIKVRGKVIAVVQMVNKRDKKAFETDDETAFQVFSTFFGLALHHAKLYDKIKRKEQKYKVALEVLGYHNTCTEEEVAIILKEKEKEENLSYNDFALNPFEVNEVEKCKGILTMFEELFDITKFDVKVLTRFVLTVKKNYRKVPYHNFDHGWSVANSMYVILKHDEDNRFDYNNQLALFVASLCHDLDHRGYTNKFMCDIESPLAAMYTTSTLEHHHFNMTVTILQQDGHNIFYQMSGMEYKDMLDSIRQCILATDLAAFFPNLKTINELVFETTLFDWAQVSHRNLVRSFCMTCADLCAAAKPFEVQLCTVDIITEEFYQQGDLERAAGRAPIPMMDRSRPEELPACQVGFLSQICMPCYTVLAHLFPTTKPLLTMVQANLVSWKARATAEEEKKAD